MDLRFDTVAVPVELGIAMSGQEVCRVHPDLTGRPAAVAAIASALATAVAVGSDVVVGAQPLHTTSVGLVGVVVALLRIRLAGIRPALASLLDFGAIRRIPDAPVRAVRATPGRRWAPLGHLHRRGPPVTRPVPAA